MASASFASDAALAALMPAWLGVPVRWGTVPPFLPDAVARGVLHEASRTESILTVPEVARIHVCRDSVTVAGSAINTVQRIGPYLRRTPLMALMLLHGGFACSGAAVAGPDGAVLIVGPTATGKSTLAAALLARGLRLLADDAAPLFVGDDGNAIVLPVWPELLLWPDAVRSLFGDAPPWLEPKPVDRVPYWSVRADRFCPQPMALRRIYRLQPDALEETPTAEPITGLALLANGVLMPHQIEQASALADPAALLRMHGAASRAEVESIRFSRRDPGEVNEIADAIMKDCGWPSAI